MGEDVHARVHRRCAARYGRRWFLDETYVKVACRWIALYRAIDRHSQVLDVLVSKCRDAHAARAVFARALNSGPALVEVTTDRGPVFPRVIDELVPNVQHVTEQYTNNTLEADHGRLKARPRPMVGLRTRHSLWIVATGSAFVQNQCRDRDAITVDVPVQERVRIAFTELALCLSPVSRARPRLQR